MPSKPSTNDNRFRTLVVHFFNRFFDTDTVSDEPVLRARLIQSLALLAVVSGMFFMYLAIRGGDESGIPFTAVFYAMVVMGLVMTFKWDSLFPDRRDYLILTPLPVSGKRLFGAKAVALGLFLVPFLIAMNIVPTLLILATRPSTLIGHLVAVLAASIFSVLFFAGLQGVLVNVLPSSTFRRISPPIQIISIAFLIMLLLAVPLVVSVTPFLLVADSALLDYVPPVWFLGLFEVLKFSGSASPQAARWALTAIEALGLTAVIVSLSYVVGYRRHSRTVLESIQSEDFTPAPWRTAAGNLLHSILVTNAAQRAVFEFLDTVSDRSSKHRISAALYSGLGLALVLIRLFVIDGREGFPIRFSTSGLLEAPAVLSFVIVAGWRATFGIPYELSANWIFQIAGRGSAVDFRKAIRKWVFTRRVLPVYALLAVFEFFLFDAQTAAVHLAVDLATTAFLIEAFFFGFPKVPFTCDHLRKKLQLAAYAVGYLYAYTNYVFYAAALKIWVVSSRSHLIAFLITSAMLFVGILTFRVLARAERARIIYDEPDPSFLRLNLS
ncbi:MAG TPA: hypothetical protein VMB70_12115 [Terriglobia bacterium]|nr:hypothetical protein [Terriglobia bacterium]